MSRFPPCSRILSYGWGQLFVLHLISHLFSQTMSVRMKRSFLRGDRRTWKRARRQMFRVRSQSLSHWISHSSTTPGKAGSLSMSATFNCRRGRQGACYSMGTVMPHFRAPGDWVLVEGVGGDARWNGYHKVTTVPESRKLIYEVPGSTAPATPTYDGASLSAEVSITLRNCRIRRKNIWQPDRRRVYGRAVPGPYRRNNLARKRCDNVE
jgi:hypothetical protein